MLKMKLYGNGDTPLSLRECQASQLEILKQVDLICREYNLRYWVMFGTLIGVIRHSGFIPWDDDIDIAMPRNDFDKLMSIFAQNPERFDPLVMIEPTGENKSPFLIARVSDVRYQMLGEYGDVLPLLGAFIDIYPLDGMGNDGRKAQKDMAKAYRIMKKYCLSCNYIREEKPGLIKRAAKQIVSRVFRNTSSYYKQLQVLCRRYDFDRSKYVAVPNWPSTRFSPIYLKSDFETAFMKFEDMLVPVPAKHDQVLKALFGEYMELPPEDSRVPHKSYSIIQRNNRDVLEKER